jgi:glutamate carboxypeptidase
MPTTSEATAIVEYLTPLLATYIKELGALSAIECPSSFKAGVDQAGAWVRQWATARGWTVEVWADDVAGNGLLVSIGGVASPGRKGILVAHLDTVYDVGIAAQRPMHMEGDRLVGPGTADNKSGLLSGLYAMAALEDLQMLAPFAQLSMLCGGDEETDMRVSRAMLEQFAPEYDAAFVLEAGRENGDIVGARKGIGGWTLEVHGHAAHAGVEPHKGANAILALAQHIVALQLLNGMRPGVSLNVGTITGGTRTNVVADYARAEFETRVTHVEDMEPVRDALEQIARSSSVVGTRATLSGDWHAGPMPRTPAITSLANLAISAARELDFEVRDAATGGVSYANLLATLGLPVLDGLGPVGGLDHSPEEYILVDSIVPRTAMLALLMLRWAQQGT